MQCLVMFPDVHSTTAYAVNTYSTSNYYTNSFSCIHNKLSVLSPVYLCVLIFQEMFSLISMYMTIHTFPSYTVFINQQDILRNISCTTHFNIIQPDLQLTKSTEGEVLNEVYKTIPAVTHSNHIHSEHI